MDTSFESRYVGFVWPRNDVLRIVGERERATQCYELLISNKSAHPIKYLKVTARDILLLFDMPANSSMTVALTPPPTGQTGYCEIVGMLENGFSLKSEGLNLQHQRVDMRHRYEVDVSDEGVELSAVQLPAGHVVNGCDEKGRHTSPLPSPSSR